MTTKEVLECALAKIEDSKHWTREANARNRLGEAVHARSIDAVRWCAVGALEVCAHGNEIYSASDALVRELPCRDLNMVDMSIVAAANDRLVKSGGVGHKGIVAAFRRAIEAQDG